MRPMLLDVGLRATLKGVFFPDKHCKSNLVAALESNSIGSTLDGSC